MTGEDFRSRYLVGERLTGPPIASHRAIDDSGTPVLVHYLLGSDTESSASLLESVRAARPSVGDKVIELTEVGGIPVVVTKVLEDFSGLRQWLEAVSSGVPTTEEDQETGGAYTQFFKVSVLGPETPTAEPDSGAHDAPPEPAGTVAPEPQESTPGRETTQSGREAPAPSTSSAPPGPPPAEVSPEAGGQAAGSPAPSPGASEEPRAPGAYTMIFGKGGGTDLEPQKTESPEVDAERSAGASTVSGKDEPQQPGGPPPAHEQKPPGVYTRMFRAETPPIPTPPREGPPATPPSRQERAPATPPDAQRPLGSIPTDPQAISERPVPEGKAEPPPATPPPPPTPAPSEGEASADLPGPPEGEAPSPPPPLFPRPTSLPAPDTAPPRETGAPPPSAAAPERPDEGRGASWKAADTQKDVSRKAEEKSGAPGAYTQIFGARGPAGPVQEGEPFGYTPAPPSPPSRPPSPPTPPARGQRPPEWQRWKDTPGASGRHIPSDDYLQHLSGGFEEEPRSPSPGPSPAEEGEDSSPGASGGFLGRQWDEKAGPGHYTMVREGLSPDPGIGGARERPQEGSRPPPPDTSTSSAPSRRSKTLTIVGLVVILLVVIALAVVFSIDL